MLQQCFIKLSNQSDITLFCRLGSVKIFRFHGVSVHVHRLGISFIGSIPTNIHIIAFKDLLSPPIIYTESEFADAESPHFNNGVLSETTGSKCIWNIEQRIDNGLHCNACGICALVLVIDYNACLESSGTVILMNDCVFCCSDCRIAVTEYPFVQYTPSGKISENIGCVGSWWHRSGTQPRMWFCIDADGGLR